MVCCNSRQAVSSKGDKQFVYIGSHANRNPYGKMMRKGLGKLTKRIRNFAMSTPYYESL